MVDWVSDLALNGLENNVLRGTAEVTERAGGEELYSSEDLSLSKNCPTPLAIWFSQVLRSFLSLAARFSNEWHPVLHETGYLSKNLLISSSSLSASCNKMSLAVSSGSSLGFKYTLCCAGMLF